MSAKRQRGLSRERRGCAYERPAPGGQNEAMTRSARMYTLSSPQEKVSA